MAEEKQNHPGFITWTDDSGKQEAFDSASEGIDLYEGIQRTAAFSYRSFLDIETNRSVRTGMGRQDYDRFRSDEAVPKKQKDIMRMCMDAYSKVGITRRWVARFSRSLYIADTATDGCCDYGTKGTGIDNKGAYDCLMIPGALTSKSAVQAGESFCGGMVGLVKTNSAAAAKTTTLCSKLYHH